MPLHGRFVAETGCVTPSNCLTFRRILICCCMLASLFGLRYLLPGSAIVDMLVCVLLDWLQEDIGVLRGQMPTTPNPPVESCLKVHARLI